MVVYVLATNEVSYAVCPANSLGMTKITAMITASPRTVGTIADCVFRSAQELAHAIAPSSVRLAGSGQLVFSNSVGMRLNMITMISIAIATPMVIPISSVTIGIKKNISYLRR